MPCDNSAAEYEQRRERGDAKRYRMIRPSRVGIVIRGPRVARRGRALTLLLCALVGCGHAADRDTGSPSFREPTVVLMWAEWPRIEALSGEHDEEDFATVADDLMWYRAEARRWFEERGIPVVEMEGRRPLSFVVDGEDRVYDFSALETLDVVVLYDRDREPVAVAPIDAPAASESYYGPLDAGADPAPEAEDRP